GQERANYALFLSELADVLGVPRPDPANASTENNDYVLERAVKEPNGDGTFNHRRIDLYKRGCFVLEAKQSRLKAGSAKAMAPTTADLAGEGKVRGKRGADRSWDALMFDAKAQAVNYARCLPPAHGWPPFVLVCDVGHVVEVFADFTGQGKNYAQFPDRQGFRIYLEDLRRDEIRARLRAIWTDPHALDPSKKAARVTREIAERLAAVSKASEKHAWPTEEVAMFLMRCLFTMFAEDVELLPKDSFRDVLRKCEADPSKFPHLVGQMWEAMDTGGFAHAIEAKVKRFNGEFFKRRTVLPLDAQEIGELRAAAEADWREVEPAIFGTLLEQALDPTDRKRLGAHYTPRAHVERLVVATIVEPLRDEWNATLATAERQRSEGREKEARATLQAFHDKLCRTRVLDPACGTGNFLYVALELLKRLEGEVLEALSAIGGQESFSALEGHTVDPHQFLGLELNPRAAAIAELVLWIGYLQWHFRTKGAAPSEPILKAFRNIRQIDAVLTWDGYPLPKVVDGREVYPNPRRPEWPTAEYIVGNPPFIGGKDLRARLGDGYTEALWAAHKTMNDSADFVMYWWDRAAELLTKRGSPLRRFGFVTTNSISQVFQRKVMERHLKAKKPVSLVMAIPDHPWTKASRDSAAVRIAMTVAEAGKREGVLREVVREEGIETDFPEVDLVDTYGEIHSDISIGVDVNSAITLISNEGICSNGMKPLGSGFIIQESQLDLIGIGRREGLERHIRRYRNGRDLTSRCRNVYAIDFFGLTADEVRVAYPEAYQHLLNHVKPERDAAAEKSSTRDAQEYADKWWLFCKPRQELRDFISNLSRFIVTVQTAKHRVLQFMDIELMPDQKLIVFGLDDGYSLGILSARIHIIWTLKTCGWQGVGNDPVYVKTKSFDPFPFPATDDLRKQRIRGIAEELDAHRKRVLAEHPHLTDSVEKLGRCAGRRSLIHS
ncbi:MAG: DNA methyltransferase, partial [Rhizobiaceae bacterium]